MLMTPQREDCRSVLPARLPPPAVEHIWNLLVAYLNIRTQRSLSCFLLASRCCRVTRPAAGYLRARLLSVAGISQCCCLASSHSRHYRVSEAATTSPGIRGARPFGKREDRRFTGLARYVAIEITSRAGEKGAVAQTVKGFDDHPRVMVWPEIMILLINLQS